MNMKEYISSKLNEPVGIVCMRYTYRGIVTEVGDDCVILKNAYCIDQNALATDEKPRREELYPADIVIPTETIAHLSQPTWCFYGYDENGNIVK